MNAYLFRLFSPTDMNEISYVIHFNDPDVYTGAQAGGSKKDKKSELFQKVVTEVIYRLYNPLKTVFYCSFRREERDGS